jgi:hypothetical protein
LAHVPAAHYFWALGKAEHHGGEHVTAKLFISWWPGERERKSRRGWGQDVTFKEMSARTQSFI